MIYTNITIFGWISRGEENEMEHSVWVNMLLGRFCEVSDQDSDPSDPAISLPI